MMRWAAARDLDRPTPAEPSHVYTDIPSSDPN